MFETIFVQPLFNFLILIYNFLPIKDLGLAVIIFVIIIRLILYPVFKSSLKSQMVISKLQPEIAKLQKQYKNDQAKQAEALMELYKTNNFNPLSSFGSLIIQVPIMIALYQVFLNGIKNLRFDWLYSFVSKPLTFNTSFLGLIDLFKPYIPLAILAFIFQFIQIYFSSKRTLTSQQKFINRVTLFISPFFTLIILIPLPSVIGVYWLVTTIFSIVQYYLVEKSFKKLDNSSNGKITTT